MFGFRLPVWFRDDLSVATPFSLFVVVPQDLLMCVVTVVTIIISIILSN